MARTSASRGKKGFNLRSGKTPVFKMMGSSPIRDEKNKEIITMGEEKVVNTTVTDTDKDTTTVTDYRTEGTGYTQPVTTPEGDKKYAELSEEEKKAQDEKYIKANTRKIIQERSETKVEPKTEPVEEYESHPDLTSTRYTITRVGKGTHTYPKGDDGKPLIKLEDNAGRVIFQGSQTDFKAKYGKHLTRGGSDTQVGNKKEFLYTRSEQDKSKAKYGERFKLGTVFQKKKKNY